MIIKYQQWDNDHHFNEAIGGPDFSRVIYRNTRFCFYHSNYEEYVTENALAEIETMLTIKFNIVSISAYTTMT